MAMPQNHIRPWLVSGGNPNHKPDVPKSTVKQSNIDIEAVRYLLEDPYKNQNAAIVTKAEDLVMLYNKIANARCEVKAMGSSSCPRACRNNFVKKTSAYIGKTLEQARKLRAQILELGGTAPPIPDHFHRDM